MALPARTRPAQSRSINERVPASFSKNVDTPSSSFLRINTQNLPAEGRSTDGRPVRRLSKYRRSPSAHMTPQSAFPSNNSEPEILQPKPRRKLSIERAIFAPASFVNNGSSSQPPSRPASCFDSGVSAQEEYTPRSAASAPPSAFPINEKGARRKSWLVGSSRRNSSVDRLPLEPLAWIAGHSQKKPYDMTPLLTAGVVTELWDDTGGMCN